MKSSGIIAGFGFALAIMACSAFSATAGPLNVGDHLTVIPIYDGGSLVTVFDHGKSESFHVSTFDYLTPDLLLASMAGDPPTPDPKDEPSGSGSEKVNAIHLHGPNVQEVRLHVGANIG